MTKKKIFKVIRASTYTSHVLEGFDIPIIITQINTQNSNISNKFKPIVIVNEEDSDNVCEFENYKDSNKMENLNELNIKVKAKDLKDNKENLVSGVSGANTFENFDNKTNNDIL